MSTLRMHHRFAPIATGALIVSLAACSSQRPPVDAAMDVVVDTPPTCNAPMTMCGSDCVDTATHAAHCGSCATACPVGQTCVSSSCRTVCQPEQTVCGSGSDARCVNTRTDNANCGACGTVCPAGQACAMGACATRCPAGMSMCASGGMTSCIDTQRNNANCGTCGHACAAGQVCVSGACSASCPTGEMMCGTGMSAACVSTQTDNANCGACGTACTAPASCVAGTCMRPCAGGQIVCGTGATMRCVSAQTDNANCGSCGNICGFGTMCSGGSCAPACGHGLTSCPAATPTYCADVNDDPANCGACGMHCAGGANATAVCTGGTCALLCNPGFADCNADPSDGCEANTGTDPSNCGLCGLACASGSACMSGACFPVGTMGGSSCAGIHAEYPSAPSGVYPVITGLGTSATMWNAYCDMTHAGGGWTLILKVAGNSTNFPFANAVWTNTTLLGTGSTDLSHTDAKFQGFNNQTFTELLLAFDTTTPPTAPNPTYAAFTMPATQPSLLSVFSTMAATFASGSGTAAVRAAALGLVPSFSLEPNCNQIGFNLGGYSGMSVRFGVMGNNEADCNTNDSAVGLGILHHTGCSYGASVQAIAGSACSCGGCTNGAGATTADPNVVQAFGYLFVR